MTGPHHRAQLWLAVLCVLPSNALRADIGGAPARVHAIVGATIVPAPGAEPFVGTIVVRDGLIEAVGPDVLPPGDARVHDRTGRFIYPGLIEPYLKLSPPDSLSARAGVVHDNARVRADVRVTDWLPVSEKRVERWRERGYGTAHVVPAPGLFKGAGAVVGLTSAADGSNVRVPVASHAFAFDHGAWPQRVHPNSLMGAIALARQTLMNAAWYEEVWAAWRSDPTLGPRPADRPALEALLPVRRGALPLYVESGDRDMAERAFRLVEEFDLNTVLVSGGSDEYRDVSWVRERLAETNAALVLALNFPSVPFWETPDQRADVELDALLHWEHAPYNPARLDSAGIRFAVTATAFDDPDSVHHRLREAIARGLPEARALASVTTEPARLLGLTDRLGTIEVGKDATFGVFDAPLFDLHAMCVDMWIDGRSYGDPDVPDVGGDVAGTWSLPAPEGTRYDIKVSFGQGRLTASARGDAAKADSLAVTQVTLIEDTLTVTAARVVEGEARDIVWRGRVGRERLVGTVTEAGAAAAVTGRVVPAKRKERFAETDTLVSSVSFAWPPVARGAPPERVLVRGATVWTCGDAGVLTGADLLVERGRIARVGRDLTVPKGAFVIDGSGKHVTPGIVDCHSHSAITGGSNESTQSATCEVRIADVLNPRSIALYRELAGGVTVSNMLHGSANVIGGQNAVIKYRWGTRADDLVFAEAPPGVKFALGENVKQSNWGDSHTTRYPQTRMGVEAFLRDRFHAAFDYRAALHRASRRDVLPPRPDLELDALLEILDGERLVHCHAYRQDEMLLLMRVMEEFGTRVATFQHALEAYKIADEIAAHGAGASLFSDWWAYKFEVYDAIPYAGHLLWERGVLTSFNSDSRDVARRLNLEAAKAVKYGGVPEAEALKFVTIHAARQLRIDAWVGTLEPGKHADFVLWSDSPLSDSAVCLETWVDGVRRFSRAEDVVGRADMMRIRDALLDKADRHRPDSDRKRRFTPTFARAAEEPESLVRGVCLHE